MSDIVDRLKGCLNAPADSPTETEAEKAMRAAIDVIENLRRATSGWTSYAWKDGEYIDNVQEFFDEVKGAGGLFEGQDPNEVKVADEILSLLPQSRLRALEKCPGVSHKIGASGYYSSCSLCDGHGLIERLLTPEERQE